MAATPRASQSISKGRDYAVRYGLRSLPLKGSAVWGFAKLWLWVCPGKSLAFPVALWSHDPNRASPHVAYGHTRCERVSCLYSFESDGNPLVLQQHRLSQKQLTSWHLLLSTGFVHTYINNLFDLFVQIDVQLLWIIELTLTYLRSGRIGSGSK